MMQGAACSIEIKPGHPDGEALYLQAHWRNQSRDGLSAGKALKRVRFNFRAPQILLIAKAGGKHLTNSAEYPAPLGLRVTTSFHS